MICRHRHGFAANLIASAVALVVFLGAVPLDASGTAHKCFYPVQVGLDGSPVEGWLTDQVYRIDLPASGIAILELETAAGGGAELEVSVAGCGAGDRNAAVIDLDAGLRAIVARSAGPVYFSVALRNSVSGPATLSAAASFTAAGAVETTRLVGSVAGLPLAASRLPGVLCARFGRAPPRASDCGTDLRRRVI